MRNGRAVAKPCRAVEAARETARRYAEGSRIKAASVSTFGQELFKYITTVVPYWRVCDEAWPLAGDYLTAPASCVTMADKSWCYHGAKKLANSSRAFVNRLDPSRRGSSSLLMIVK